jgi:hypothetical protein
MKLRRLTFAPFAFGPDSFCPLPLRAIISSWGPRALLRDACRQILAAWIDTASG